jgi:hypothetical protein
MPHADAKTPRGEFRDGGAFTASDQTAQGNERDARIARKLRQRKYVIFVGSQNCLVVTHEVTPNANMIISDNNFTNRFSHAQILFLEIAMRFLGNRCLFFLGNTCLSSNPSD